MKKIDFKEITSSNELNLAYAMEFNNYMSKYYEVKYRKFLIGVRISLTKQLRKITEDPTIKGDVRFELIATNIGVSKTKGGKSKQHDTKMSLKSK